MKRKRSWIARILALAALAGAIVAVIVVVSNAHLHSNSDNKSGQNKSQTHKEQQKKPRTKAKKYVVQSGDTLTSIAHKTGIPVAEIQAPTASSRASAACSCSSRRS